MPRLVESSDEAIAEAAARLHDGRTVAFPTETVYGLGADTFAPRAIERVYQLKGRPLDNPLIAHVLGEDGARRVAGVWDDRAARVARRFWPGPLTLVLPRGEDVPEEATAGWSTIAVRAPAHPVARKLLASFGGPISAPSANRSGHVSPTTARHVADDFADAPDLLILDGGSCAVGIESTVLDLGRDVPTVLRPGAVPIDALRDELNQVAVGHIATQAAGPGTSMRHYAPRTPARLVPAGELAGRLAEGGGPAAVLCFDESGVVAPHRAIVMPGVAQEYAAYLYEALRSADASGATTILIEEPPSREGLWLAIHDRLRRATGTE